MKFLLSLALAFCTLAAHAAVPDYKAFRGTGGISVVSNPPNGTIVIDGSGISGGNATNAQPPSAVLSNLVQTLAITNGATVFLDAAGVDSNVGSDASPMKTADGAAHRLRGRGTLLYKTGYLRERINLSLWTNLTVIFLNPTLTTNDLGTNISAFTDLGGGLYRATTIPASWTFANTNDTPFIYQRGSNSLDFAIPKTTSQEYLPDQSHRMIGTTRLVAMNTVAGLTNGSFAVSNSVDVYFKFADGGVPNSRFLTFPSVQTTNAFTYNGQNYTEVKLIGVRSYFGYDGANVNFSRSFINEGVDLSCNYNEGLNSAFSIGKVESYSSTFAANGNDGAGYSANTTNNIMANEFGCLVWGNGDEGTSTHELAKLYAEDGRYDWNVNGGMTPVGGSTIIADGSILEGNRGAQVVLGISPTFYDATRTNTYTKFVGNNLKIRNAAIGVYLESGTSNLWCELYNSHFTGITAVDLAYYNDAPNQRLKVSNLSTDNARGLFSIYTPQIVGPYWLSVGSNSVTLGQTNLTVTGALTAGSVAANAWSLTNADFFSTTEFFGAANVSGPHTITNGMTNLGPTLLNGNVFSDAADTWQLPTTQIGGSLVANGSSTLNGAVTVNGSSTTFHRDIIIPWELGFVGSIKATNGPNQIYNLGSITNLDFVPLSAGDASNSIPIQVAFTQDATGGYFVTNNAVNVPVNTNADATTLVNYWVANGATNFSSSAVFVATAPGTNTFGYTAFTQTMSAPTNTASFTLGTNDFVLNQYYTNTAQRSFVFTTINMTNVLGTDVSKVSLFLDQDGDGSWEMQGVSCRLNGVALMAGSEELSAALQPSARFLFTNQTTGTAVSAVNPNSSQWVRQ